MLQPTIFGVSLSISPARPRLLPLQDAASYGDIAFDGNGGGNWQGQGRDEPCDDMWDN